MPAIPAARVSVRSQYAGQFQLIRGSWGSGTGLLLIWRLRDSEMCYLQELGWWDGSPGSSSSRSRSKVWFRGSSRSACSWRRRCLILRLKSKCRFQGPRLELFRRWKEGSSSSAQQGRARHDAAEECRVRHEAVIHASALRGMSAVPNDHYAICYHEYCSLSSIDKVAAGPSELHPWCWTARCIRGAFVLWASRFSVSPPGLPRRPSSSSVQSAGSRRADPLHQWRPCSNP